MRCVCDELDSLSRLLHDFDFKDIIPIPLKYDNMTAIYIASNSIYHVRMKHIVLVCHFTQEKLKEWLISLSHVSTSLQQASILTKSLQPHPPAWCGDGGDG